MVDGLTLRAAGSPRAGKWSALLLGCLGLAPVPPDVLQPGAAVCVDAPRHISSRSHHAGNTQCLAAHSPNPCQCLTCASSDENASTPREDEEEVRGTQGSRPSVIGRSGGGGLLTTTGVISGNSAEGRVESAVGLIPNSLATLLRCPSPS